MLRFDDFSSPNTRAKTTRFLLKLQGPFLRTFSGSLLVANLNKKRFLFNYFLHFQGVLSFQALIIGLEKAQVLKWLSVHIFPTNMRWKISSSHTFSSSSVTSSSSLDSGTCFQLSMKTKPNVTR